MNQTRRDDKTPYLSFRPGRFFKQDSHWYYRTRESSEEGPFKTRLDAEKHLQIHLSIFDNLEYPLEAIQPGILAKDQLVVLQPLQMHWR